jgi:hypothetical protein
LASLSNSDFYSLRVSDISFGTSFVDLASSEQVHPRIELALEWAGGRIGVTLQHVTSSDGINDVVLIGLESDDISLEVDLANISGRRTDLVARLTTEQHLVLRNLQASLADMASQVVHVASARPQIDHVYSARDPLSWTAYEVPYILASDRNLTNDVAAWITKALQVGSLAVDPAAFAFRLTARERLTTINLANAGRGTQAVLPVVTLLKAIASSRFPCELLSLEEPEAHLHPSAHGALADLVIQASERAQVIVETHSENFILRLRRRIAEKSLNAQDVLLYYVDEDHGVERIHVDQEGVATNWPRGVFESDLEEAEAIVQAKLQAMRRTS